MNRFENPKTAAPKNSDGNETTSIARVFPSWLAAFRAADYSLDEIGDATTRRAVAAGLSSRSIELPLPGVAWPSSESGRQ